MTPTQRITLELVAALEHLVDKFDKQGATSQATQLSALLDDYYAEIEEEAAKCKQNK